MITLNLLPPREKSELRHLNTYYMLRYIIFLLLICIFFIAINLLAAKSILEVHFTNMVQQNYLNTISGRSSFNQLKSFNEEIFIILKVQNQYIPWTKILKKINNLSNDKIHFMKLGVDDEKRITLNGIAETRNDLIKFKKDIDDSQLFEKFEIPLDVLVKKENIIFDLVLKIK